MKVFLGGEGPDDLGDWAGHSSYREGEPGVIEALLRRASKANVEITGAVPWKRIRKFKAGQHRQPEQRNILGLALHAQEAGATILAFARDRDGDRERERDVEQGIRDAQEQYPEVQVIGGVAIEELEAWVLALLGERRTQEHKDAKEQLRNRHGIADRRAMIDVVNRAALLELPPDAHSLTLWLKRAQAVLKQG